MTKVNGNDPVFASREEPTPENVRNMMTLLDLVLRKANELDVPTEVYMNLGLNLLLRAFDDIEEADEEKFVESMISALANMMGQRAATKRTHELHEKIRRGLEP